MKQAIPFAKMHALGNDFMLLDLIHHPIKIRPVDVRRWAHRHRGIGFDQLLCLEPPRAATADFFMRVYNADGSLAEQCGNGLRCFYVFAHSCGLTGRNPLVIETTERLARVEAANAGQIRGEMGAADPSWQNVLVPALAKQQKKPTRAELANFQVRLNAGEEERISAYPISLGNPHLIVFVASGQRPSVFLGRFGPHLVDHPALQAGANVGFASLADPENMVLCTYERGSGATLACGSNACAAAALAMKVKAAAPDLTVHTQGGKAQIQRRGGRLYMQSRVHLVYRGVLP